MIFAPEECLLSVIALKSGECAVHTFRQSGKKGAGDIGEDQRHDAGLVGLEAPGIAVHPVAQMLGGLLHLEVW